MVISLGEVEDRHCGTIVRKTKICMKILKEFLDSWKIAGQPAFLPNIHGENNCAYATQINTLINIHIYISITLIRRTCLYYYLLPTIETRDFPLYHKA